MATAPTPPTAPTLSLLRHPFEVGGELLRLLHAAGPHGAHLVPYARFLRTFRRELKTGCLASLLWGAVIAAPLWGGTQIGRTIQEPGPVLAAAAAVAALLAREGRPG